mmetsp:Transcript_21612/g.51333  ORF Transcript_21612/g.51333 Transcript_21612/m.51333 type:complete len:384 (+) Transcript_21612:2532-3683(+)
MSPAACSAPGWPSSTAPVSCALSSSSSSASSSSKRPGTPSSAELPSSIPSVNFHHARRPAIAQSGHRDSDPARGAGQALVADGGRGHRSAGHVLAGRDRHGPGRRRHEGGQLLALRPARPGADGAPGPHLSRHARGGGHHLRDGPARRVSGGGRAGGRVDPRFAARPADGPHGPDAGRGPLGGAFRRPVRGMRQGGALPACARALSGDAARRDQGCRPGGAGEDRLRRQPRCPWRRAVRELGPGAGGGGQRAPSRRNPDLADHARGPSPTQRQRHLDRGLGAAQPPRPARRHRQPDRAPGPARRNPGAARRTPRQRAAAGRTRARPLKAQARGSPGVALQFKPRGSAGHGRHAWRCRAPRRPPASAPGHSDRDGPGSPPPGRH